MTFSCNVLWMCHLYRCMERDIEKGVSFEVGSQFCDPFSKPLSEETCQLFCANQCVLSQWSQWSENCRKVSALQEQSSIWWYSGWMDNLQINFQRLGRSNSLEIFWGLTTSKFLFERWWKWGWKWFTLKIWEHKRKGDRSSPMICSYLFPYFATLKAFNWFLLHYNLLRHYTPQALNMLLLISWA